MPLPSEPKMAMEQVASVVRPVSVTMLFVVYCVVALCNPYSLSQADCRATGGTNALSLVMVYSESSTDSDGARLGGSILNAVMIVLMFTVVTFFMYCLFKYRCMKFIWGYLGLSVGTLLGFFGFQLIYQVIVKYDIVLDKLTLGIFLFNWTVVGILSVFWKNPAQFGQFYLVFISSMMAWILAWMPEWTGWAILIALAVYDLFAVLCPGGPLRLLVEEAQERDEAIPALVYGTTMSEEERQYRQSQYMAIAQRQQQRLADRGQTDGDMEGSSEYETESSGEWTEETVTDQPESELGSAGGDAEGQPQEDAAALSSSERSGADNTGGLPKPAASLSDHPYPGADTDSSHALSVDASQEVAAAVSRAGQPGREQTVRLLQSGDESAAQQSPQQQVVVPAGNLSLQQDGNGRPSEQEYVDDDEGQLKLGLGDFVFYSVLVAKGSRYGVATATASFVAILMGLCLTLMFLGVFQKALPALPISIALGAMFVASTHFVVTPFAVSLGTEHMAMI